MKQHLYQITVKHIADAKANPSQYDEFWDFEVGNHDDIFQILQRLEQSQLLDQASMKPFVLGLKLLTEVALQNKNTPLFQAFLPELTSFIKNLKQHIKSNQAQNIG